jgi:hypothetical protein
MTTGPRYWGQRLDGLTEELHRAVDRLRGDTVPTRSTIGFPHPPRRRRRDPGDGQAALVEEAS